MKKYFALIVLLIAPFILHAQSAIDISTTDSIQTNFNLTSLFRGILGLFSLIFTAFLFLINKLVCVIVCVNVL